MIATFRNNRARMIPIDSPPTPEPMISASKGFSVSIEDHLDGDAVCKKTAPFKTRSGKRGKEIFGRAVSQKSGASSRTTLFRAIFFNEFGQCADGSEGLHPNILALDLDTVILLQHKNQF